MTALLGYHGHDGAIYIATDGRSTANRSDIVTDTTEKVVLAGRWTIACSGTHANVGALTRAREQLSTVEDHSLIGNAIRDVLVADGFVLKSDDDGGKPGCDSPCLISDGVGLWKMFCDFGLARIERGCLTKAGSGGDYAIGAASVLLTNGSPMRFVQWLRGDGMPPTEGYVAITSAADVAGVLRAAILTAIRYDSGSGGCPRIWRCRSTGGELVEESRCSTGT